MALSLAAVLRFATKAAISKGRSLSASTHIGSTTFYMLETCLKELSFRFSIAGDRLSRDKQCGHRECCSSANCRTHKRFMADWRLAKIRRAIRGRSQRRRFLETISLLASAMRESRLVWADLPSRCHGFASADLDDWRWHGAQIWFATERQVTQWIAYLRCVAAAYRGGHYRLRPQLENAPAEFKLLGTAMEDSGSC